MADAAVNATLLLDLYSTLPGCPYIKTKTLFLPPLPYPPKFYTGRGRFWPLVWEFWTQDSVVSIVIVGRSAERMNTVVLPCWAHTAGLKHSVILESLSLHCTAHTPPVQHVVCWMEIQEPYHCLLAWLGGIKPFVPSRTELPEHSTACSSLRGAPSPLPQLLCLAAGPALGAFLTLECCSSTNTCNSLCSLPEIQLGRRKPFSPH